MRLLHSGKVTFRTVKAAVAVTTLIAALGLPAVASAGLERVGPTLPVDKGGFPAWYQDTSGLVLEFCSPINQFELDNGLCLLLPADTIAPENFAGGEGSFSGEHFYWSGEAVGDATTGGRALLVLALEAAFANELPINGDQAVFARLRIRLDNVPTTGDYTFYTPYGRFILPGESGDRIFFTDDVGCFSLAGAAGDFSCALQGYGPFLVPSDEPGGAELPPITFPEIPGKQYISDGNDTAVTNGFCAPAEACDGDGNYITSDGPRNPNIFRVEAPDGTAIFETTDFAVTGRLFTGVIPGRVSADRSSYSRTETSRQIDTFATAFPTRTARSPGQPIVPPTAPELALFSSPCDGTEDEDGNLLPPFGAPAGIPVPMAHEGTRYFAQTQPAVIPTHVCLEHSNNNPRVYFNVRLTDKVNIAQATYDIDAKTLTVAASSADLVDQPVVTVGGFGDIDPLSGTTTIQNVFAPPHAVLVHSMQQGHNSMQVTVTTGTSTPPSPPLANDDVAVATANFPEVIDVLTNDTDADPGHVLSVVAVTQPAHGTVTFTAANVTYTANPGYSGPDAFTYTITDGTAGFDSANVILTVSVGDNLAPVAGPDVTQTNFNVPVTIPVLQNDSDPNGDPITVTGVSQPANGEGVVTFDASSVTFTPALNFFGTAAFTYTVSDGSLEATGDVTVTIQAQEAIAFTRAEYRTAAPGQYRIDGTGTIEGSTITVSLVRGGTVVAEIGEAQVEGGLWTLRVPPSPPGLPFAVAGDRVRAVSSFGTTREQNLAVRR